MPRMGVSRQAQVLVRSDVTGEWIPANADASGCIYVELCHHDITQKSVTSTGIIYEGVSYLHWITINPSAKASYVVLTDSLEAGATPVWAFTREAKDSEHINFLPAMKFNVGIYVEELTNITAMDIAYNQ